MSPGEREQRDDARVTIALAAVCSLKWVPLGVVIGWLILG